MLGPQAVRVLSALRLQQLEDLGPLARLDPTRAHGDAHEGRGALELPLGLSTGSLSRRSLARGGLIRGRGAGRAGDLRGRLHAGLLEPTADRVHELAPLVRGHRARVGHGLDPSPGAAVLLAQAGRVLRPLALEQVQHLGTLGGLHAAGAHGTTDEVRGACEVGAHGGLLGGSLRGLLGGLPRRPGLGGGTAALALTLAGRIAPGAIGRLLAGGEDPRRLVLEVLGGLAARAGQELAVVEEELVAGERPVLVVVQAAHVGSRDPGLDGLLGVELAVLRGVGLLEGGPHPREVDRASLGGGGGGQEQSEGQGLEGTLHGIRARRPGGG